MKKVVVTGASTYGVKNMGDDAMLACMVQVLKQAIPDVNIQFLCRHPDTSYDQAFGFTSIKNLDHDTKEASEGRFFWGMNNGDPNDHLITIRTQIEEADLLIIGGNSFMEISPNQFLRGVSSYAATLGTLAKFCGTPFALFGLNVVDEIRDPVTQSHARFLIENAVHVTIREQSAWNYLDAINIDLSKVSIHGDPAFGMKTDEKINPDIILQNEGIQLSDKPLIGIAFRHEYWRNDPTTFNAINASLANILDQVCKELDAEFLFIPNCTYTKAHKLQDDRLVHRQLRDIMISKDRVHLVEQDLSVFETFALFKKLDFHVSNRRHSCIFAAKNSIPFLCLSVSLKGQMKPFLEDLNVPEQLADLRDEKDVVERILKGFTQRQKLSGILRSSTVPLYEMAKGNMTVILDAIDQKL